MADILISEAQVKRSSFHAPNLIPFSSTEERLKCTFDSDVDPNVSLPIQISTWLNNTTTKRYFPKMAPVDLSRVLLLKKIILEKRRHCKLLEKGLAYVLLHRRMMMKAILVATAFLVAEKNMKVYRRSCKRLVRNRKWWDLVWITYSDEHFKKTLRVSRATFDYILSRIRHKLQRQTLCEEPISPKFRLGLCLYRLGRGDYFYSIAEMVGLGPSTVCTIVHEVNEDIVSCLWEECITAHFPTNEDQLNNKIPDMEEFWQFPFSWAAVDGCHIPIKCPAGGQESAKEYHQRRLGLLIVLIID